jgi:hypothetical protein
MYFWVPQSGTIGLGISILSYAGQVYFGMISDRKLVKTPDEVVARFVPEFEKLLLAATVGALAQRDRGRRGQRAAAKAAGKTAKQPVKRASGKRPPPAANT